MKTSITIADLRKRYKLVLTLIIPLIYFIFEVFNSLLLIYQK